VHHENSFIEQDRDRSVFELPPIPYEIQDPFHRRLLKVGEFGVREDEVSRLEDSEENRCLNLMIFLI